MRIIASFDDGSKEDLLVAEIMETYKIPTIFYLPSQPEKVNEPHGRTSLNYEERFRIAKRHEIGSHTQTHPLLTRISVEAAREQIVDSKAELESEFGRRINAFCYPRGYANPEIQQIVQEAGYAHARGVTVGYLDESENDFYEQTTVHVGCQRKEYAGLDWYQYAQEMIQQADNQSVFHLWGHGWEIAKDVHNFDLLDKLCYQLTQSRRN